MQDENMPKTSTKLTTEVSDDTTPFSPAPPTGGEARPSRCSPSLPRPFASLETAPPPSNSHPQEATANDEIPSWETFFTPPARSASPTVAGAPSLLKAIDQAPSYAEVPRRSVPRPAVARVREVNAQHRSPELRIYSGDLPLCATMPLQRRTTGQPLRDGGSGIDARRRTVDAMGDLTDIHGGVVPPELQCRHQPWHSKHSSRPQLAVASFASRETIVQRPATIHHAASAASALGTENGSAQPEHPQPRIGGDRRPPLHHLHHHRRLRRHLPRRRRHLLLLRQWWSGTPTPVPEEESIFVPSSFDLARDARDWECCTLVP